MSRLVARLSKLEQRQGASKEGSSFIIQRQLFWREGDVLRSVPAYASVLNGSGWARIVYSEGESEASFDTRVASKACGDVERLAGDAGSGIGRKRVQVDAEAEQAAIAPGSPWENGYCESFNSRFRDEPLNGEVF